MNMEAAGRWLKRERRKDLPLGVGEGERPRGSFPRRMGDIPRSKTRGEE